MLKRTLLILLVLGIASTARAILPVEDSAPVITGQLSVNELYDAVHAFEANAKVYNPPRRIVRKLSEVDTQVTMLLFLGTWNTDSQIIGARFIKLIQSADNPKLDLKIFGVDRSENEPTGTAHKYHIDWIPTAVYLSHGEEIARQPITSRLYFAERVLQAVTGKQPAHMEVEKAKDEPHGDSHGESHGDSHSSGGHD
jgi:hypothetical protein